MPQWSLRTLLVATAVVPLAIFAISKSTRFYVSAAMTVAAIAWIAVAIMAWIDTGSRQAWARGVILAATAYGLLVVWMGTELEPHGSKLATSGALFYAHRAVAKPDSEVHVPDGATVLLGGIKRLARPVDVDDELEENLGLRAASANENSKQVVVSTGTLVIPPIFPYSPPLIPSAPYFAKMGHIYWGVLIGLAGGWFANWINSRKVNHTTEQIFSTE